MGVTLVEQASSLVDVCLTTAPHRIPTGTGDQF